MTESEKQEIVNRVLSALSTNSTTIDQLIETDSCADGDYFENSKGNKVSYGNMMKPLHKKIDEQEKQTDVKFSELEEKIGEGVGGALGGYKTVNSIDNLPSIGEENLGYIVGTKLYI